MSIKEIDDILAQQDTDIHTRSVMRDIRLLMKVNNLTDSSEVDSQVLIALIQKEPVAR
jgi:hypothetical protein